MTFRRWLTGASVLGLLSCTSNVPVIADTDSDGSESGDDSTSTPGTSTGTGTSTSTTTTTTTTPPVTTSMDTGSTTLDTTGDPSDCIDGSCLVDILVVVDNSGTMAIEQAQLGAAMLPLAAGLEERGYDAQVMFTTTDFGNPSCTPFKPKGYQPSRGAPTATSCTDRLGDFTGLGTNPDVVPEACEATCPSGVAPNGDPFVAFSPGGTNLPGSREPADVDGDGVEDSVAARAMACLAPQGINGCGYESPLETMLQALNPDAAWNGGNRPFLREGATLGIVLVTDEADCSIRDFSVMENADYQEIDPTTMLAGATSAICWNAGVTCVGPDAAGVYSSCESSALDQLQPTVRYSSFLIDQLRDFQGKDLVMLGVVGVPTVTEHARELPQTPTAGGVLDLVYRDWRDGEYPGGDILPAEFAAGIDAAQKRYLFGVGPGCTGGDAANGFTGQALPPVRVLEVCEALNEGGEASDIRCCLESVCDGDYEPAMNCLLGMLENVIE